MVQVHTGSRCLPKTSLVTDIHNDLTEVPKEKTAGSHFYFAIGLEGVSPYIFVSFSCSFCLDPPRTPRDAYPLPPLGGGMGWGGGVGGVRCRIEFVPTFQCLRLQEC